MQYFKNIICFVVTLFVSSYGLAANTDIINSKAANDTEYLFIHTAREGTVNYDAKSKNYIITLKQYSPWVTFFSTMPARKTGFMQITDFTQLFTKNYIQKQGGLNSGIVAFDQKDQPVRYVMTLKDFNYNSLKHTLSLYATQVPGDHLTTPPSHIHLHDIAFFIDDVCASCGGRGT